MQQFLQFMANHWVLWTLFFITFIIFIAYEMRIQLGNASSVTPQNAVNLINREHAVVVDLRPKENFQLGHILDAQHIPISDLPNQIKRIQKYKTKPIILIDSNKQDAQKANVELKKQGFSKIFNLQGGLDAWKQANLPLVAK